MRTIAVLGATGSVGTQALDVARTRGYRVDFLCAGKNAAAAESLAREFSPREVAMADENAARDLSARLSDTDIRVLSGKAGILAGIAASGADTFVHAVTGEAGLALTLAVIERGKRLALANKESLVIAGDIVMARAREKNCPILPVDSEHSAIFQSLSAGAHAEIKKIILTASGGPFRGYTREKLSGVTLADTLAHPTWRMGKRITVDSATLMNKGFEIMEASYLFDVPADAVEVVVHPESIIHSAVEYVDNTVVAEMSAPDMRAAVQYAVDYPARFPSAVAPLSFSDLGKLTFAAPDTETFPLLPLAREVFAMGGAMGAVLNAADEVAVAAFLEGKLPFPGIFDTVAETVSSLTAYRFETGLDGRFAAAGEARAAASSILQKYDRT